MHGDNASVDWNAFDPEAYSAHNYATLRADDKYVMTRAAEFFGSAGMAGGAHAVDVGPGANLYPALTLLPFSRSITLWEYSTSNVAWLRNQVGSYAPMWDVYWDTLAEHPTHGGVGDPRAALAERGAVVQGSLFDLPHGLWDLGTMFFVAESMTTQNAEFEKAVHRFVGALRPGAPFAAAFVENSEGYSVAARPFPAVRVGSEEVRSALAGCAEDVAVERIGFLDVRWRDGYTGMVFATGRASRVPAPTGVPCRETGSGSSGT
ncbi:SCO2525 family SAM-dependent methyltransferase [Uniformispora flossi]|uniref:SCO2525 family SAM-dependent methyltransferase n=1 Tax=Uniformispora flossi TaxID=3390723 RepID=UPI003C2DAE17